jgi:Ribbon-helix-helix protein, copG family
LCHIKYYIYVRVIRASALERSQRINMALDLLKKDNSPKEVVSSLVAEFDLSTRQAYRYLQQAHKTRKPLALPEPKTVFTVKLPLDVVQRVRQIARGRRQSISDLVTEALEDFLTKRRPHG